MFFFLLFYCIAFKVLYHGFLFPFVCDSIFVGRDATLRFVFGPWVGDHRFLALFFFDTNFLVPWACITCYRWRTVPGHKRMAMGQRGSHVYGMDSFFFFILMYPAKEKFLLLSAEMFN